MSPSSHYVALRLRALIWSCLDCDLLPSALFFAERYYCIDSDNHQARHLYASTLLRSGHNHSALHLVQDRTCLGCTEVFSRCCNTLGRYRAGQEALAKCLAKGGAAIALEAATYQETRQFPDAAVLACRAGNMAMKGNLPKEAIANFNSALAITPFMWEAIEGLCRLGSFPELDEMLPSRGLYSKEILNPTASSSTSKPTSLFTPEVITNGHAPVPRAQTNGVPFKLNGGSLGPRDSIGSFADSSFGEYNSPGFRPRVFTAEMMLTAAQSPTATRGGGGNGVSLINTDGRPATKRARGEMLTAKTDGEGNKAARAASIAQNGKRVAARAVPEHVREPARRSTRSSATKPPTGTKIREIKRAPRGPANGKPPTPTSEDDIMSVDSAISPIDATTTLNINPIIDSTSARSEVFQQQLQERQAVQEADSYIIELVRIFAKATQAMAMFRCQEVIDMLELLPEEQQYSSTVMTLLGRAFFEKLDYIKAERCFYAAREYDPYRHQDMDVFSTLLWHLSRDTLLAFLSQELVAMDNTSPEAWIAAGNCLSLQKEHHQALTCFARAAQLDQRCAYAYNLSGHESIAIDEPDKAVDFFRQALKIDSRHYPAWYGLGMVFYRSTKLDEAQWHFRKAIQINPFNSVLICCEGMVQEQRKNYAGALEIYTRAVHVAPESPLVLFKRVRMLVECGGFEEAKGVLHRLMDTIPEEVNVPFMLAQVYQRLGDVLSAAKYMAIAQDAEPKIANIIRSVQAQKGFGKFITDATAPSGTNSSSMNHEHTTIDMDQSM